MKTKKQNPFSFGKGWYIIIIAIIGYWFHGGYNTDGLNVSVPVCAVNIGVEQGVLFTLVSYACLIGVVIHIIWGQIVPRTSVHICMGTCFIIGGWGYILQLNCHSIPVFILATAIMYGCVMNAAFMCSGIIIANYFPKRKGTVMGYVTAGLNICSMCFSAIATALFTKLGSGKGAVVLAIGAMILGLVCILFVRDDPAQIKYIPDNVSQEEYEANYVTVKADTAENKWTVKKLLKTPMVYCVAIVSGMFNIATGCMMSNMVARNIELGMDLNQALGTMAVVAAIGIVGSWVVGIIDDSVGTKPTMIGFGVFYFIGFLLNFWSGMLGNSVILWISLLIIGCGIGGSANFTTSFAASVFGRHGFDKVNSVLFPIQCLITALNFMISGVIRIITGNDLKYIFLCAGIIALITSVIVVIFVREPYKYNEDFNVDKKATNVLNEL